MYIIKRMLLVSVFTFMSTTENVSSLTPVTHIESAADSQLDPAVRLNPPTPVELGFNPEHLTGCEEMDWYRKYAGLPTVFDSLGYRESRCNNDVRTYCCYGYWQNYLESHLSVKSAYREWIINECGVREISDIFGNSDNQKYKQACVTFVVYSISGLAPWKI